MCVFLQNRCNKEGSKIMKSKNESDKEVVRTAQPQVFTLCGVQGCCPTVTIDETGVVITDDFGGKVTLKPAEFAELQNINKA